MPAHEQASVLTLEVTGPDAAKLGAECRRQFPPRSATIGRTADNDWVLPDPLVSGRHATIDYADGTFYITDTSTNGVFINSRSHPLVNGQPHPIKSGDLIIIKPYRIEASISKETGVAFPTPPAFSAGPVPPDPLPGRHPFQGQDPFGAPSEEGGLRPDPGEELDPLKLLGVTPEERSPQGGPQANELQWHSPLEDHFHPPSATPVAPPAVRQPIIPPDYNPADLDSVVSPADLDSVVSPPPTEPAPAAGSSDLQAVLAGAGLGNAPVTPEFAAQLGAIVRVVVAGVMDLLGAREKVKDSFRMQATRLKPEDNNPLKFSANVSDALHNLVLKRNAAYLGPVEAFEDAFSDLRNHEMAMIAGMRLAFESMLAEFAPERLQGRFDRHVKKSLLGTGAEAQYWAMYCEYVRELARDADSTYRTLFADRFVAAYEEQMERLCVSGRRRKP